MSGKKNDAKTNPLGMRQLENGGPFVLPPMACSAHRRDYFQRANRILATYMTLTAYADAGKKSIDNAAATLKWSSPTGIRVGMGSHTFQTTYRLLQGAFAKAGGQLNNQVFLLIYGNFEAFLIDLISDALKSDGETDPIQGAVAMLASTKWEGRFNRISQKLSIGLGKQAFIVKYSGIEMGIMGKATNNPIEFLQAMADFRHRLVHSAGRADAKLLEQYPNIGVSEGDLIQMPFGFPMDIHLFFVPMTDLFDEVFAARFGWKRDITAPEHLIDKDLRII